MEDHEKFMAMAIEEARLGLQSGEDPFGAVIVREGEVISTGRSVKIYTGDVTDHAEVGAIGKATRILRNLNLAGCTLYSSCEPCPMCCGAIINTNIPTLVIGVRLGALKELFGEPVDLHEYTAERLVELTGASTLVIGGVLEQEAKGLFKGVNLRYRK